MNKSILTLAVAATLSAGVVNVANACTSAIYNNGDASLTMRTMDWFGHDDAVVVGAGQGIERTYGDTDEAMTTQAKYASMKIKSFAPGLVAETMNEEGLVARILYLGTDYTEMAPDRAGVPDVGASQFPNYAVDNFSSVAEVVKNLEAIDVIQDKVCDLPNHEGECIPAPVHYHITDASGDSAVIEFVAGEVKVYHGDVAGFPGAQYLSNDPEFGFHLTLDKMKTESGASIRAYDRRLRAKEVVEDMYARDVKNSDKAMLSLKSAGATVFAGYDQEDPYTGGVFPTLWTVYTDQNAKQMFLDRYDTWEVESYNFDMFNSNEAKEVVLGAHPAAK